MEASEDTPLSHEELAAVAGARAALAAFLNIHFTTLPDEKFVAHLRGPEFGQALEALAAADGDAELARGAALMRGFLAEYAGARASDFAEALGVDRTRLYRGVAPGYGPPPPQEAVWDKRVPDPVEVLKALAAAYVEAGVGMAEQAARRTRRGARSNSSCGSCGSTSAGGGRSLPPRRRKRRRRIFIADI